MELRQLRNFVEVVDRGSFSAAAKSVLISQPALTRQVQQLERECGVALFERTPRGAVPTAAGRALYQHVMALLRYADSARDVAREAGPVRETVEIGLAPGLPDTWLMERIDHVRAALPYVYLQLVDVTSTVSLQRIRSGQLDIALIHEPPPEDLFSRWLLEEPFGVAFDPATEPLARVSYSLHELDGRDVLVHAREQVRISHDQLVAAAQRVGSNPRWHFANYTENARACLHATGAHNAIMLEPSARRMLPQWPWVRLVDPPLTLNTWLIRQQVTRTIVAEVSVAIADALPPS